MTKGRWRDIDVTIDDPSQSQIGQDSSLLQEPKNRQLASFTSFWDCLLAVDKGPKAM